MGFFIEVIHHFRVTWRLFWDERIRWWQRAVFVVPLLYLIMPLRYDIFADLLPIVGLLDDWLLAVLCSYVFVAICPRAVVREHRTATLLSDPDPSVRERVRADLSSFETLSTLDRLEVYRHPREILSLAFSLAILAGLSALGGVLVGVLLVLFLGFSYMAVRITQAQILRNAIRVGAESLPKVQSCIDHCMARLPDVPVDAFVVQSPYLNAYTFGLDRPYTMVLCSRLVEELDTSELTAIIGHELGHILFEHTFLSSLMGGLLHRAGVTGFVWALAFFRWRRFAELSADRISLLACGELDTSVRALVRLASGITDEPIDVDAVLSQVYAEKGRKAYHRWSEYLETHPYLVTRIQALVDFDAELLALDVEKWLSAESSP